MEIEIWKDVVGFEGIYSVSSLGNVKRMPTILYYGTKFQTEVPEELLHPWVNDKGYLHVNLHVLSSHKTIAVHRLVCLAFLPNTEKKRLINHKDCNILNNHLSNLEWCTHQENIDHALDNNLWKYKTSKEDINSIKQLYSTGSYTHGQLGRMFNLSQSQITRLINNKRRKRLEFQKDIIHN